MLGDGKFLSKHKPYRLPGRCLKKEKLSGNNFNDWFRLDLSSLESREENHVIEQPVTSLLALAGLNLTLVLEWTSILMLILRLHVYARERVNQLLTMFLKMKGICGATGTLLVIMLPHGTGYLKLPKKGSKLALPVLSGIFRIERKRNKELFNLYWQMVVQHKLDSTYLWHCRLAHINKKRIKQLQQDGLLKSTDDESFDKCESCLSGKMTENLSPYNGKGKESS
ncbi:retrotransposon protein, putative, ty1-copia subclass [Tanacetum coccineum]|uniref:Retrotransposon protein, putative, ty1-copia subclass n=1 Tax=Tanacetum coccineum TaxID=301880 RepID=A0ABQ4WLY7_9ASTR